MIMKTICKHKVDGWKRLTSLLLMQVPNKRGNQHSKWAHRCALMAHDKTAVYHKPQCIQESRTHQLATQHDPNELAGPHYSDQDKYLAQYILRLLKLYLNLFFGLIANQTREKLRYPWSGVDVQFWGGMYMVKPNCCFLNFACLTVCWLYYNRISNFFLAERKLDCGILA